jgi:hypothetical protein
MAEPTLSSAKKRSPLGIPEVWRNRRGLAVGVDRPASSGRVLAQLIMSECPLSSGINYRIKKMNLVADNDGSSKSPPCTPARRPASDDLLFSQSVRRNVAQKGPYSTTTRSRRVGINHNQRRKAEINDAVAEEAERHRVAIKNVHRLRALRLAREQQDKTLQQKR